MNACHADVPHSAHLITHRFRSQRRFLSHRDIACSRSHDGNNPGSQLGSVTLDSDQPRRFMPLSIINDVSNLAKSAFIGVRNQHVWRALNQSLDDTHDLSARLTGPENNFRKTLPVSPSMIYSSITDVFVMQVLDPLGQVFGLDVTILESRQQPFQLI